MEPFEENCPIPSAHEKYTEARYFLIQCLLNYHVPQPFLHNLNAFIQAFRNITFMLQSEDHQPSTFQTWYEVKREEMRKLPPLRRLVDARNIVVKQSSLTAKSTVKCGLFRGRRMKLSSECHIKPFTKTETILALTSKFVGDFFLGGKHDIVGEQAGVERVWIVEELGEGEVMAGCIEAMNYMINFVEEAHHLSGRTSGLDLFGIEDMREFSVFLETDADPTLFAKWGWLEG
ncbi:MAG: hypothetical protein Q7U66_10660 [Methylobacter sp.]|nr:hypothetical protein [Methylobacter sp.]